MCVNHLHFQIYFQLQIFVCQNLIIADAIILFLSNVPDISNLETLVDKKCRHVTSSHQVTNAYLLYLTFLKCICIKQFESLQLIKTIFVRINPLKVSSTENYT